MQFLKNCLLDIWFSSPIAITDFFFLSLSLVYKQNIFPEIWWHCLARVTFCQPWEGSPSGIFNQWHQSERWGGNPDIQLESTFGHRLDRQAGAIILAYNHKGLISLSNRMSAVHQNINQGSLFWHPGKWFVLSCWCTRRVGGFLRMSTELPLISRGLQLWSI